MHWKADCHRIQNITCKNVTMLKSIKHGLTYKC
jgi:hypothetical protein